MYPYRIRIFDPELIKIFERLSESRIVEIPRDRSISTQITWKIRPIRHDLFIGDDKRGNKKFFALSPQMTLLTKKNKKGLDLEFRKLF
jgi:hypothetical protein